MINKAHIAIAAGGTGGHMVPAEGVAEVLTARGYAVSLITDKRGNRYSDIMTGFNRHVLDAKPVGGGLIGKIRGGLSIAQSTRECVTLYKDWKPAAVIGFGGYPSMPAVLAARLKKIPYLLHEQNTVLGRVNRLMAGGAQTIALAYADTSLIPAGVETKVTGNPVRADILKRAETAYKTPENPDILNILIMGGSQGAHILSAFFPEVFGSLDAAIRPMLHIAHQARAEDVSAVEKIYKDAGISAEVAPYFTDIPTRMSKAHLVISRAGASSLAEITALGRPSILVPLAIAMDNHQVSNAAVLKKAGGAWVFEEAALDSKLVRALLTKLFWDRGMLGLAAVAAKSTAQLAAAENLADLVEQLVQERTKT